MALQVGRVSSRDVARVAGVSPNTVSLVMRDSPLVAAATKVKVRAVIDDLGYQPHAAAAALRSSRSQVLGHLVGGVLPTAVDVFRHNVISAVSTRAQAADHYVLLDTFVDGRRCADLLNSGRIDGALIDYLIDDAVFMPLALRGVPIVLVGRDAGDLPVSWVKADERGGASQAACHLLEQGHRRIAMITAGNTAINTIVRERITGFSSPLSEAGLPLSPDHVVHGDWTFQSGYVLGRQLLATAAPPTALFALSELMAVGVLHAARDAGVRIPDDLAIVTTEDSPWVEYIHPQLSAVHVPMYDVGTRATETLLALLADPRSGPHQIVLPTSFVVRQSSVLTNVEQQSG